MPASVGGAALPAVIVIAEAPPAAGVAMLGVVPAAGMAPGFMPLLLVPGRATPGDMADDPVLELGGITGAAVVEEPLLAAGAAAAGC